MPTFREATARTVEGLAPTWRNAKHTTSWLQTLDKYAFPALADLRVDQIERQDVLRALQPIRTERRETARRIRQRIRKVLEWCQAQAFVDINMAGEVKRGNRSSGCLRGRRSGAPPPRHASPSPMRFVPVLPPRPPRGRASTDNVQREAPLHAAQSRAQSTATPGAQRKQRPSRPRPAPLGRARPSTRHTQETLQVTTTPIQHGHDRLVVALDGEITPHSAQEFVVAIDQRLEQSFCRRLEVFVASPGGSSAALEHMVRAFARWRAAGVDVRAFVIVRAITARAMERARTTARALSEAPRRTRARTTDERAPGAAANRYPTDVHRD